MNRRNFAALLPALAASLPALAKDFDGGAQTATAAPSAENPIETGVYSGFMPPAQFMGRSGHSFFHGMLPTDIGCEAHVSYLAVGAQHEPEEKHKHSEIWLVREGKVELRLNGESHMLGPGDVGIAVAGTLHWVRNAGDTVASYFVIEVGTGAMGIDAEGSWGQIPAMMMAGIRHRSPCSFLTKLDLRGDGMFRVGVCRLLRFAALLVGARLADVDTALEERAVLNGDALGGDIAGERTFAADVDAIAGGDVAAHLAEHDNLAGGDVGGDLTIAAHGDAIARQIDGAFDFAVDVEGFGAGNFAFNDEALADGGLFARCGCGGGGRREALAGVEAGGGRSCWTRWFGTLRSATGAGLIGFPHDCDTFLLKCS